MMNLGSLDYYELPENTVIAVSKKDLEEYVRCTLIEYLNGFPDGICDQIREDGSEWDEALKWIVDVYIVEAIEELEQ